MDVIDKDPLFNEAVKLIKNTGIASSSFLQCELKLGYARAARIIDQLEESKIIGPIRLALPREVLIPINKKLIAKNKRKSILIDQKINLLYPKILVWLRDKEVITQEDIQEKFRIDQVISSRILALLEHDGLLEPQFGQSEKHKVL